MLRLSVMFALLSCSSCVAWQAQRIYQDRQEAQARKSHQACRYYAHSRIFPRNYNLTGGALVLDSVIGLALASFNPWYGAIYFVGGTPILGESFPPESFATWCGKRSAPTAPPFEFYYITDAHSFAQGPGGQGPEVQGCTLTPERRTRLLAHFAGHQKLPFCNSKRCIPAQASHYWWVSGERPIMPAGGQLTAVNPGGMFGCFYYYRFPGGLPAFRRAALRIFQQRKNQRAGASAP